MLYALDVQKFVKVAVYLVPALSHFIDSYGRLFITCEGKFEYLHSREANGMI